MDTMRATAFWVTLAVVVASSMATMAFVNMAHADRTTGPRRDSVLVSVMSGILVFLGVDLLYPIDPYLNTQYVGAAVATCAVLGFGITLIKLVYDINNNAYRGGVAPLSLVIDLILATSGVVISVWPNEPRDYNNVAVVLIAYSLIKWIAAALGNKLTDW